MEESPKSQQYSTYNNINKENRQNLKVEKLKQETVLYFISDNQL